MRNFVAIAFLFFFGSTTSFCQELLTVEDAVAISLENNYNIQIAKNELKIDQTGISLGFAGILPTLEGIAEKNNSILNLSQTRSDGTMLELDNAKNSNLTYGVALDWTIFDGFGMFSRYKQLQEFGKLGEAELKIAILTNVSAVMNTYYTIVQQEQQLTALDSSLVISEQRVTLADNRFTIGKASKLEVLNAKVDLNTDQTLYLRKKETVANLKIQLNELLARDTKIIFSVIDEIFVEDNLDLNALEDLSLQQNPELQSQIIAKRIAELELKNVKASRFPTLAATGGYTVNDSENSLGFTTSASSQGFNYGLSARLNIFDGFTQNRNEKIAKIQVENTEIIIEQQKQSLQSALSTSFQTYQTNLLLTEIERKNEEIAKENLDITLAKFKIGTIPTIEVRTAQVNYINAKVRATEAIYQAKLSEIALKELAGNLSL